MSRSENAAGRCVVPVHSSPSGMAEQVTSSTTGCCVRSLTSAGVLGREATRRDRTPGLDRHADQGLALVAHGLAVLVPVGVLAGDAAEVVDQRLHGVRLVDHL